MRPFSGIHSVFGAEIVGMTVLFARRTAQVTGAFPISGALLPVGCG
jgi:hypothetical protein